jgi:uncharacterized protein
MVRNGTQSETQSPVIRRLPRDPHLHVVLAGTLATGLGLWFLLPPGYSQPVASEPWRLLGFLLLYPVIEEWLFRGLLQGELLRRPWGPSRYLGISIANLLTTVAFVLLHFVHQPPGWALAVAVPSLVLGHFRERYSSLWPPVMLHVLFNAVHLAGSRATVVVTAPAHLPGTLTRLC